jgi:glycopeptide antibiotics resistance protein
MHGTPAPSPRTRRFGFALVIFSLAAIAWLTLRPAHASSSIGSHLCVICGPLAGVDILLNTLLFVPLGVGLGLSGLGLRNAVLMCFALSLSIESAQALIVRGRDATLSDLLTNTFGGAIGVWSARAAPRWLAPSRKSAAWLAAVWAAIWLLIQIGSSYSFAPSLPPSHYHGEMAHAIGRHAMFHGHVDSARIGTIPIPNGTFADSRSIRQLLLNGTPIVAVVRLDEPTPYFTSIIRVADDKQRGITSIAEQGDRLVFSIRTGASSLRLREPAFGMPGVFGGGRPAADSAAELLVISARFNRGAVQLVAQTRSAHRELNVSPRAAQAWSVVLPFHGHLESGGMERIATFLWTSLLLIPLGYWVATLARQLEREAAFSVMAILAALLAAGLILVPVAFALRGATPLDWIAAVSGLGIGAALTLLSNANEEKNPASV